MSAHRKPEVILAEINALLAELATLIPREGAEVSAITTAKGVTSRLR